MTPLHSVSVIIPNYDHERFVKDAIESALSQDHPLVEVIVVDDCSTDGSRAVIQRYADRVRTIFLPENGGHTAACNAGWSASRHKIVIFLDSDDMLAPDAASAVARIWRPGISKVQWCLSVVDAEGRPIGNVFPKYKEGFTTEKARQQLLFATNYLTAPTSGNAYARELLKAGSNIEGPRFIDAILNTIAPLYGDVITLESRVLSYYRIHQTNSSLFTAITPSRFHFYLEFERARIACLRRHCQKLGIVFDAEAARGRFAWYRECEVVLGRLAPEARTNRVRSAAQAVRAILSASDQSGRQRVLRALWLVLVASSPQSWARKLIGMRYMPTSRPGLVEKLARGFRRPPAPSAPPPALRRADERRDTACSNTDDSGPRRPENPREMI